MLRIVRFASPLFIIQTFEEFGKVMSLNVHLSEKVTIEYMGTGEFMRVLRRALM